MKITELSPNVPLILAAHGTRDKAGEQQCRDLAYRVAEKLPGRKVTLGFVELVEPTIGQAVTEALEGEEITGELDAVCVPLMLSTGGHVRIDIPEAIDEGRGDADVRYGRPLQPSPLLTGALEERISKVLQEANWSSQDTACVVVGRGTLVTEANARHYQLSRTVAEDLDLASVHPGFIQVSRPSVPEALSAAAATGAKQIVVAQHFLFFGKLRTWVAKQVAAWQETHPEVQVRIGEVIGDCEELAELVIDRYAEQLECAGLDDSAPGYLASLFLSGREVLVVGGGAVAARRIPTLLAAGAKVKVVAPNTGITVGKLAREGKIRLESRGATRDDVTNAWYVLAASNDPEVNQMIAEEAEAQKIFCVRADKSAAGSAATPAVASAGGLTVAVVGERNPKRSVSVRDELLKVLQG